MSRPIPRRDRRIAGRFNRMIQANPMHRGQEGRTVIPFDDEVREELVSRVRQEILAGTYDTLDKFHAALDRLADRLERD